MSKVSVIMPSYNSEKFIEESINSVLKQTYKNWKLLIIDDCSTDKSLDIITHYSLKDNRIKSLKTKENSGPAKARNIGIENATGIYIAFLDSDDLWHNKKLQIQIDFMEKNNYYFSFTAYERFFEKTNKRKIFNIDKSVSYLELLKTNSIGCLTVVYNAEKIGKRYFDSIAKHEDYVCWLKILKEFNTAHGIDEVLAYYRISEASFSSNKFKVMQYQWKIYREYENLSILKTIFYFLNYAFNGLKKNI